MEKPRSIYTPESQKSEEALQPLAAALLGSAPWRRLNKTEKMTAKEVRELASDQAARAEQLVPFLQEYGYDADNKPQPASEQLANRESALYRDALAASYIQELGAQGLEPSDGALIVDIPLSDELPESEQRRLLLPIEYALRAAEHEQQKDEKNEEPEVSEENGTSAPVVVLAGVGKTAVGSDRSEGAKAAAA